jgi:radical SAM protein with 4Fe4S-binding SPASM domain
MSVLLGEISDKAMRMGVPLNVHLDITYRCNERCVHCYLDHDDHGEMTTSEIKKLLKEMAEAGVFILTLSGGEIMMRKDFFEILEYAREMTFVVKLKTNAILIRDREADRIRELGAESIQISIYSHRPEVHDAITKVPGSLKRSLNAIRFLKSKGLHVIIANVLMKGCAQDYTGVRALAAELGVETTLDPMITPMMDGSRSTLALNVDRGMLKQIFADPIFAPDVAAMCATPDPEDDSLMGSVPCSAGHSACYVSPYGDVYPCVQFPFPSGNVRRQRFIDIWNHSEQLNEVRSIRIRDLPNCSACGNVSSCTRCPGLAYMEGNMRGPSTQDCERSFMLTGIESVNLQNKRAGATAGLVQIRGLGGNSTLVNIQAGAAMAEGTSA